MIYSQTAISQLLYYDVICIGNYAAIVADHINCQKPYKIAVLNFQKQVKASLTQSGPQLISVKCLPKEVDIIRKKVLHIIPKTNTIVLDDGHRIIYKYLVHGQDGWTQKQKGHPLYEALESEYSKVFCNIQKKMDIVQEQGNVVFYAPKGAGNFRQNYQFIKVADKLEGSKSQLIVLLEGDSFYPHCPQANKLILNQLEAKRAVVSYNVNITKIDYLRRILSYSTHQQQKQIPYQSVYCLIGQSSPTLLEESGVDPKDSHPHLLHNNKFDNIYVIGADIFPTTFSFFALSIQIHHLVCNIIQRLIGVENRKKAMLSAYDGSTSFLIYLGAKTIAKVSHKYEGKECMVESVGGCWSSVRPCMERFLCQQFLNFDNFGPPHYLWAPALMLTQKWKDESENIGEKDELVKLTQINFKANPC